MLLDCKDRGKKNLISYFWTQNQDENTSRLTLLSVLDSAHAACSATATRGDSISPTSPRLAGLSWLPNYTSRDHGVRRTQGQEGRLAVTGRVTWCSVIRRHDNPAAMLSIQQHKLYEGLEGGDNERVAELQEAPLLVTGSKASTWSILFYQSEIRPPKKALHSNFAAFWCAKTICGLQEFKRRNKFKRWRHFNVFKLISDKNMRHLTKSEVQSSIK